MSQEKNNTNFNSSKIYLPLIIGIVAIGWMFLSEFDISTFEGINFGYQSIIFIVLAFGLMFVRDACFTWRFKIMSDNQLSWLQSLKVHILSEFTSAITPSAVGGSGLLILFLNKEKISAAKSTTIMIANLFIDELFFILICPIIFLLIPLEDIFNSSSAIAGTITSIFWGIYFVLVVWTFFLFVVLFFKPQWIGKLGHWIFKIPFLKRWQHKIQEFNDDLIIASTEVRKKSFSYWITIFITTSISWIARFMVVNALFMVFVEIQNHLVIFARQVMLWIVMIVSPTPGGSGVSEYAFKEYYNDISLGAGPILVIILLWRLISYYMYLLLGTIITPRWIKKSFSKEEKVVE